MYLQRLSARFGLHLSPPAARAALFALALIVAFAAMSIVRAA
jgi:hypothetical protein